MIIKVFKWILESVFWQLIFNQINKINFVTLINYLITLLLTMSPISAIRLLKDLTLNRINNNLNFMVIATRFGIQPGNLIDTKSKKFFWLGLVSTLLIYRWFLLLKQLILWPFKLGLYSFIYMVSGIDLSWFLNWFDSFSVNIPKWVYFQYLMLYSNWLNWWKNTAEIKNLTTETLPPIPKDNTDRLTTVEIENNSWINIKNIIIGLTVIALIGVGIWYFYYSGPGTGAGNGGAGNPGNGGVGNNNPVFVPNPPAPNPNPIPHQISVTDNQSPTNLLERLDQTRTNLLERLDQSELDRIRQARIEHLRSDRLESALSQDSLNTPVSPSTSSSVMAMVNRPP